MNVDQLYGSRPDYLPRELIRLDKARQPSGKFTWVGRNGVTLMDPQSHLKVLEETIERFPLNRDRTISWNDVDDDLILWSQWDDELDIDAAVVEFARSNPEVIFEWGNLVIPTICISLDAVLENVAKITRSRPEFWISSTQTDLILERTFDGLVTLARIPSAPKI